MKKLLLLLLVSFNISAGQICRVDFVVSDEREDGTPLLLENISHHTLFIKNMGLKNDISPSATRVIWWSNTPCPVCKDITMTTTDVEGRESIRSEITCDYTKPPAVCW